MQAKINSSTVLGVEAIGVTVEVSVEKGLGINFTGLADDSIRESYSRIASALNAYGYAMPRTKLVINLAPAGIRKMGTAFDLPIAVAILLASGQVEDLGKLKDFVIAGELGLDGTVQPVRGALCMAHYSASFGYKSIMLPQQNIDEAALISNIDVYPVKSLQEVLDIIQSDHASVPYRPNGLRPVTIHPLNFFEVKGQHYVKRALEIAAAGGHNAIMIGPQGSSKTMLAKRLPSILPPMSEAECMETTRIYSVAANGSAKTGLITDRPFRSPHHTCSDVALVGGGSFPVPGEISLANNGVLFLDELAEFKRSVIESLRQPLEDGKVVIARAQSTVEFPSRFMLVAAMNPCLCGYLGHPTLKCQCSKRAIWWYRRKTSGPLFDRIDLQIAVDPVPYEALIAGESKEESSESIRARVTKARARQLARLKNLPGVYCNAQIPDANIYEFCKLDQSAQRFLGVKMNELHFSARSFTRILKVARTIADLARADDISVEHIAEAIQFRYMDKPEGIDKHTKNK